MKKRILIPTDFFKHIWSAFMLCQIIAIINKKHFFFGSVFPNQLLNKSEVYALVPVVVQSDFRKRIVL
jgi:hypothetical protein